MEFTGKDAKDLLAKNGFKKKDFSCRVEYGVYNKSLNVKVKDLSVNIDKVATILKGAYLSKRYDSNGEMLEGGHDFVFVDYDYDLLESYKESLKDLPERIYNADGLAYDNGTIRLYMDNYKVLSVYKNDEQILRYPCESKYCVANCLAQNYYILGV